MKRILIAFLFLSACTSAPVAPEEKPLPPLAGWQPTKVAGSACATYRWKDRGRGPVGFFKGVASVYQRAKARPIATMARPLGPASTDALAHYGLKAGLKENFTLLFGLGMRESSGFYGTGRDASAENVAAETAETGLFQFSHNLDSRHAGAEAQADFKRLYDEYREHPENCMVDVFKEGTTKKVDEKYYGTGPGLEFQKFTRTCPAFATEYAAVGIRARRAHWGPINEKKAEYRKECEEILE